MKGLSLSGLNSKDKRTIVRVGSVPVGEGFVAIAGPCSIENEEQIIETALAVKRAGANILRGGAFKPRTSPYSFQGLGEEGLRLMAKAREISGLPIVSEVMDTRDVELVCKYVDALQIGSRNMQNFSLLKEVGKTKKPILLKRGMNATLEEWLNAAEYVLAGGNPNVILCERGIRTHESYTRNTLDLSAIPALRELTHLPVLADPSHGTGRATLIEPMSLAALACGAAGIMVEVHPHPEAAVSDKDQTITPAQFASMMNKVRVLQATMETLDERAAELNAHKPICEVIEVEQKLPSFANSKLDSEHNDNGKVEIIRDEIEPVIAKESLTIDTVEKL